MTEHVLVADDEPDMRLLVRRLLARTGFEVTAVASGEEVLERYADGDIDALVLDHRMEGLSGIETARQLRDTGCDRPILLFSAYLEPEIDTLAVELGVDTLPKADAPRIAETLRELLDRHTRG